MNSERVEVPSIDLNNKVTVPEGVLFQKLEGESVLLNLDSEMYYGLDDVGTRMWLTLESSASVGAAYMQLLTEYDVDGDQLLADLIELIQNLLDHKLIRFSKM